MNESVKPRLNELLKKRGWTQTELAQRAGVPQAAVSRFDRSVQCKFDHLFKISRALGVAIEELFEIGEEQA